MMRDGEVDGGTGIGSGKRGGGGGGGKRGGAAHARNSNPYSRPTNRPNPSSPTAPLSTNSRGRGTIKAPNPNSPRKEPEHVRKIKEWMKGRIAGPGVLNLMGMVDDPILLEAGIYPPGHVKALPQIGEVLWKIAKNLDGEKIHTISLANNKLQSLGQLKALALSLPYIRALDLSGNEGLLQSRELEVLGNRNENGLRDLREIKLDGVGFRERMIKEHGEAGYRREMLNRFPNLHILDQVPIPRICQEVPVGSRVEPISELKLSTIQGQSYTWPCDVAPGFQESPVIGEWVNEFLAKFFACFDDDRTQLLNAYAANATLSISAATSINPRARAAHYHYDLPNQTKLSWAPYIEAPSRNLFRVGNDKRVRSLIKADHHQPRPAGQQSEVERWLLKTVPRTRHPKTDAEKWMFDAINLGAVGGIERILLTVHGEYEELPSEGKRSFSRAFVLAPAPAGSPAAISGWNAIIISDQLSVRNYSGYGAFTQTLALGGASIYQPTVAPIAATPAGIDPSIPADIQSLTAGKITPQQMLIIAQLQQQTNLTTIMAINCAEVAGYDLMMALNKFQEVRSTIPPDAFRS